MSMYVTLSLIPTCLKETQVCPITKFPWPIRKLLQILRILKRYLTNPLRSSFHWGPHLHLQTLRSLHIAVSLYPPFLILSPVVAPQIVTHSHLLWTVIFFNQSPEEVHHLPLCRIKRGHAIAETISSPYAKKTKRIWTPISCNMQILTKSGLDT